MPNFNTHWLVALEAIGGAPQWIVDGSDAFTKRASAFSKDVRTALENIGDFNAAVTFGKKIKKLSNEVHSDLLKSDAATCFSAYMCGACGPDFWTLPQPGALIPSFCGEHHFDLGHYNRTHQQFVISVERLKNADKEALQTRVEMAYFLGMATHVAADLVIHQLVNRSAGAYNLLEKAWENESGNLTKNIWSTHNKVEHYWDSYVRYRYLGDYGPVFEESQTKGPGREIAAMGLPVIETLQRKIQDIKFKENFLERVAKEQARLHPEHSVWDPTPRQRAAKVYQELEKALTEEETRIALERPLTFPQLFADRLLANHFKSFVYQRVIDKNEGAYPKDTVPQAVFDEARSDKMKRNGNFTEANKAAYFSSEANKGTDSCSNNYLTYIVCPNLKQLKSFGRNVFYDLDALEPFIHRAVVQAKRFVAELWAAYQSGSTAPLRSLARFWNLDTGLGLRVVRRSSCTPKEVITRLDFVHVFDADGGGQNQEVSYSGGYPYLDGKPSKKWEHEEDHVFPTYSAAPFKKLGEVREQKGKYLDQIRLEGPAEAARSSAKIDDEIFFNPSGIRPRPWIGVETSSLKQENRIVIREMAHRLNLELRVSIAKLGSDQVGLFFQGDRNGVAPACQSTPKEWLLGPPQTEPNQPPQSARMLDLAEEGRPGPAGLRQFTTRLLANLEPNRDLKPSTDGWNNVISYREHERNYGRNFVISTGRAKVLYPVDSGNFDGRKDFGVYSSLSPSEQIFFSLHPLVRTPKGVFDVFSKERVSKNKMTEIRRIQSVGFVKIVLYYELGPKGGCQLSECYVDGLRVPVEEELAPAPAERRKAKEG